MGSVNRPENSGVDTKPYLTEQMAPQDLKESLNDFDTMNPVQLNTHSYARRFFNSTVNVFKTTASSIASRVTRHAVKGTLKTFEYLLFSPHAIRTAYDENIRLLKEMTDSQDCGVFLSQISDVIATSIMKNFQREGVIKQGIAHESTFVKQLTELMVTKVAVNVGKKLQSEGNPVTAFAIGAYVTTVIKEEMDAAQEEISGAGNDPNTLAKALEKPVDTFLSLAFGNANELPLRGAAQNYAWSLLKNKILPNKFYEYHLQSMELQKITRLPLIEGNPKRAFLFEVSKKAEAFVENEIPLLLADHKIAESVAREILQQLFQLAPETESPLLPWLTQEIQSLGQGDVASFEELWKLLGKSTSSILSYCLYNVSKTRTFEESGTALIFNLLDQLKEFDTGNRLKIQRTYQELAEKGDKPETSYEYIQCFVPLIEMLEERSGIQSLKSILPVSIGAMFDEARNKEMPAALAGIYEPYIVPILDLYRSSQAHSSSSQSVGIRDLLHGEVLSAQIEDISEKMSAIAASYFSDHQGELVAKFSDALFDAASSVKVKLREAVTGEQQDQIVVRQPARPSQDWFTGWIDQQIKDQGAASDPRLRASLKSFGGLAETILERAVLHISKTSPDISNIYEALGGKLANTFYEFVEQNGAEIQEYFIRLHHENLIPEEDPNFIARFTPLCRDLLEQFGYEESRAQGVDKLLIKTVLTQLPKFLASKYCECLVPLNALKISQENLKRLFSSEDNPHGEKVSREIESLCTVLAQKIVPAIKDATTEKVKEWTTNLPDGLQALSELDESNRYLENVVKSILMQLLVNYLEGSVQEVEGKKASLSDIPLSKILDKFVKTLDFHLKSDSLEIRRAGEIADPKERLLALRAAFSPVTQSLTKLISPEKTVGIPAEMPFKDLLGPAWEKLQTSIIPDVLAGMYMDTTTWSRDKKISTSVTEIIHETKTLVLPKSCKILAEWMGQFIPAMLHQDKERFAEDIYKEVAEYLTSTGNPEGISVGEYVKDHDADIKKFLLESVFSIFGPEGKLAGNVNPLGKYIEGALLQLSGKLTRNINDVQGRSPAAQQEYMVKLGINLLKVTVEHFKILNKTTEDSKHYAAHEVPHEKFVEGFEKVLHPGIPRDLELNGIIKKALHTLEKERRLFDKLKDPIKKEACRQRIREARHELNEAKASQFEERKHFFKPFTEQLIALTGLSSPDDLPADLPVPDFMRPVLWERFKDQLLPSIMENIFEQMSQPSARIKMMVSGLEKLNAALNRIDESDKQEDGKPNLDDKTQERLNKVCGELVLELVQLVPQSMVRAAFKIDKFKLLEKHSAEIVGKAVREYLVDDLNLLKIMDDGLLGVTSAFKTGGRPDLSEETLEASERKKIKQNDLELKKMRKLMVATTHRVMADSFEAFFTGPYVKLKKICDICVKKVFGKYGENICEFFNFLAEKTIFGLIEQALALLSYPFRAAFWFFMELHIGRKADHVIKSLQLDIHENLLYKLTDALVFSLTVKEEVLVDIDPLFQAAEYRDKKEKEDVKKYIEALGITLDDIKKWAKKKIGKKKTGPRIQEPAS